MVWLKMSDTSAHHPVVTRPLLVPPPAALDGADMVNLLFGFVVRCATHSAGFQTDYIVHDGTAALMGGPNWLDRAERAASAGYWTRVDTGWLILDDPENFLHIRLKQEIAWERQRRRDTSDASLVCAVRLRDGDACRYCGLIVNWRDRKSGRGGTYDHRVPGRQAQGPDDLLVACNSCNGARANSPDADTRRPRRPAPAQPFYGTETVALLAKNGVQVRPSTSRPGARRTPRPTPATAHPASTPQPTPRPGPRPDTATDPSDRASSVDTAAHSATRPPAGHRDTPRPGQAPATATPRDPADRRTPRNEDQQLRSADPADRRHAESRSPGRDGSGRESTYLTPRLPARKRRGRRGKR